MDMAVSFLRDTTVLSGLLHGGRGVAAGLGQCQPFVVGGLENWPLRNSIIVPNCSFSEVY